MITADSIAPLEEAPAYKVICISIYRDELALLDEMVDKLKARGCTKANRSWLIREALARIDIDQAAAVMGGRPTQRHPSQVKP